jgi:hypothetical protein
MRDNRQRIDQIVSLVEQEAASFQALLQSLEEEWKCLRNRDSFSLALLQPSKEARIDEIQKVQAEIRNLLSDPVFHSKGAGIETVLRNFRGILQPGDVARLRQCRETVRRLRKQVQTVNDRNRHFIQETLSFIRDIFTLLTGAGREELSYAREGKTRSGLSPSLLSREV